MDEYVTYFYSKRTGEIKSFLTCNTEADFSIFGVDGEDYKLIWDKIFLKYDKYVLDNIKNFKINLDTLQLEMISIVNQYPIAAQ